jgi:hypothetical protein
MSGSAQITGSSTLIDGNFTINGGGYFDNKNSSGAQVSRIGQAGTNGGEMILSNNAGTAKIALTPTTANFKTNITSSGNISASGYISASEFVGLITTAQTASYITTAQTASYVLASSIDQPFTNITASGNISASGKFIGTELSSHSDLIFDVDGADILLKDDGTEFGRFKRDTSDFVIKSAENNKDIIFRGQDGGSTITALTLDMSEAGSANFNNHITASGNISASGTVYAITADIGMGGLSVEGMAIMSHISSSGDIIANSLDIKGTSGHITASGNISASGYISASEFVGLITTAQTASYILASNIDQPFTDITASGNISASGYISASNLDISGSATIDGSLTLTQTNTLSPLIINNGTGTEITFPGTTETNITSEGLFQFKTSNNQGYGFGVNDVDFKAVIGDPGLATTATTVIADTYNGRLILRGNSNPNQITGSIEITGSALTTTSDLIKITDGGINVVNGNISSSNSIIGNTGSFNRLEVNNSSFLSGSVDIVSSGSDILNVQGSQGQLFNVDDDLLHNLFLVTDISGESLFKVSGSGLVEVLDGSITTPQGTINELTASYAMTASRLDPPVNYKPIVTHTSNFNSDLTYAGRYNIVGGTLAVTVTTGSTPTNLEPGMEWDFFQTSSGDSFTFTQGTGVEIISRNSNKRLAAVGSAGTLKYISGQTFHLIGDLTI